MADGPPPTPDPEVPPRSPRSLRRRRRWLRRAIAALLLLPVIALIAVVVALVTLPRWLPPDDVRREVIAAARDALGVEVELASLDYDLAWGLELRGLRIGPPPGFERDPLRLGALELRWALPWSTDGRLVLERLALVEPHVVLETRGGVRNFDRLFPPGPPAEASPPGAPLTGPLSPVSVDVTDVAIERARVELVGEGPQVDVDGISAHLGAHLDPERLTARLVLTTTAAPDAINVRAIVARPLGPPLTVATGLRTSIAMELAARASDGLALDDARLTWGIEARSLTLGGDRPLPPARVALRGALALDGRADTLALEGVRLDLDTLTLLALGARVDGVLAAAADAAVDTTALREQLGWLTTSRPGRITVSGPGLRLPLGALQPYARPFVPELSMSGEVRLDLDTITGRLPQLLRSRPERGAARLVLDRVRVQHPAATLGEVSGSLALSAGTDLGGGARAPVLLAGRIDARGVRAPTAAVAGATLQLDGRVDAPDYPATGSSTIAVAVAVRSVEASGASIDGAELTLSLTGVDPLDPARAEQPPVRVLATLAARGVGAGQARVASARATLDATIDRLLAPAARPIRAKLTAATDGVAVPAAQVALARVELDAQLDDPRHGRPLSVRARGRAEVGSVRTDAAQIGRATLQLDADASGVDPTGTRPLPARARVDAKLDVPALSLTSPAVATSAAVETRLELAAEGQRVTVHHLRARLGDAIALALEGQVADALAPAPALDVALHLAPVDLSRPLIAALVGEPFSGQGTVAFEATARGRWTGVDDLWAHIDAPPLTTTAQLALSGVGVDMPARQLHLARTTGTLGLELSGTRAGTQGQLALGALAFGPQSARDAEARWSIGLDEGVWRVGMTLDAAQLGDATRSVEAATVNVDVVHPPFGDVMVRRFDVRAPGAGVEATLGGRLARGRFGAVLPALDAQVSLDFDRLKSVFGAAVPDGVAACSGQLAVELGAHATGPTQVAVEGALTLRHFGWSNGETKLIDASGRVPLSQRLQVAAPHEELLGTYSAAVTPLAEGGLGLQRSMESLADILVKRSKLVLTASDVLQVSPRTADYESLRPYYRSRSSAKLSIAELTSAHYRLTALAMDVAYRDGVFRIDRLATGLWAGNLFGEMAFQIAGDDHLRLRLRATMTDINLDVPVAAVTGRAPASGSDAVPYQVSGNLDLRVDLRDRTLDGYFDFTKMGAQALVGLIDGLDPEGKSRSLQATRESMDSGLAQLAVWTGVTLVGTVMTIRNNLFQMTYRWDLDVLKLPYSLAVAPVITRLLLGPLVKSAVKPDVQGYSLSNYLEQPWVKNLNELVFAGPLRGRLVVEGDDALAGGGAP